MVTGVPLPASDVMARVHSIADRLPVVVDVEELLVGRAALLGLRSRGRTSAGGTCRLLRALDGWVAVNLARPSDSDAVGAIVGRSYTGDDPWHALEEFATAGTTRSVTERCQLLGVPGATLEDPAVDAIAPVARKELGAAAHPRGRPRVVDLSSMWAGPLCARLLGLAGMDVLKVESTARPDGARAGDPRFFAWLHEGHANLSLDLAAPAGRDELRRLVAGADVVIESSRPRALQQLGIDAEAVVGARPGLTWVSITGYGRGDANGMRVAFGDDAAVAGGLVGRDGDDRPTFLGDAIADPLTGLRAAVAATASVADGGGHLLDVSLAAVARSVARPGLS